MPTLLNEIEHWLPQIFSAELVSKCYIHKLKNKLRNYTHYIKFQYQIIGSQVTTNKTYLPVDPEFLYHLLDQEHLVGPKRKGEREV